MSATGFSTEVLDRSLRKARSRREELRVRVLSDLQSALDASPVPLEHALMFGSVIVPGRFRLDSDVDVAVECIEPREYLALKSYLEGRLVREVDLVELDRCHFAESIRRNGVPWKKISS